MKIQGGTRSAAVMLGLFLLVPPREAPAQSALADSAEHLDTLAAHANQRGTRESYELALRLWAEAAALYRRNGNQRSEGRVLLEIGRVHRALGFQTPVATEVRSHQDAALTYMYQALGIARRDTSHALKGRAFAYIGAFYYHANIRDSSLAYFRQALPELVAAGERKLQARTLYGLGQIYLHADLRADSALEYYQRALYIQRALSNTKDEEALTLRSIASTYQLTYLPDSAIAYYHRERALFIAVADLARESQTLTDIGGVHRSVGRLDSAEVYYRQALVVAQRGLHSKSERELLTAEGRALKGIGAVLRDVGRYDSALVSFHGAMASFRQAGDSSYDSMLHNAISSAYITLGRVDSALAHMHEAHMHEATFNAALFGRKAVSPVTGDTRSGVMDPALAVAPKDSGDAALVDAHHSLAWSRASGFRQIEFIQLRTIGNIHESLGSLDSARLYYHQALALARKGNVPSDEASEFFNLGVVHWKRASPDSALAYFLQALERYREVGARWNERYMLFRIGQIYQRKPGGRGLRAARAYYDSASSVYAAVSANAGGDANRVSLTEQSVELSQHWARAWLARVRDLGILPSAMAALAVAERGRAQGLLDLMRRSASDAAGAPGVSAALTQAGADLAAEADALLAPLRRTHTAALTYLVTPDTLIIWLLSPAGALQVHRRAVTRDSLVRLVQSLRAGLGADSARRRMARGADNQPREQERGVGVGSAPRETFYGAASQLGALLLPADFLARLPTGTELVLLPHDVLGLVPFAALPVGNGEPLGVRYALRYAPSLAALNAAEAAPSLARGPGRIVSLRQALVVGNPSMPTVRDTAGSPRELDSLPEAEKEARAIATRLKTTALTGTAATEGAVRARLNTAPLIHLATHGLAYGSEALVRSSYVALAPDAPHDGLFTLGELLDDPALRLSARLVVLSACQTGLGDMKQAEGTVGLQRAYLAKGAASVLVSLWSVDDRATRMLMEKFYAYWLDDRDQPSKAEALRRAQRDVRTTNEDEFAHPHYWAAFQLVGGR